MSYPGTPDGGQRPPESPYTLPASSASGDYPPPPGAEPVSPSPAYPGPAYPSTVPVQPTPTHDQGPSYSPGAAGVSYPDQGYGAYSMDAANSSPPVDPPPTLHTPPVSGAPVSPYAAPVSPYAASPQSGPPQMGPPQMGAPVLLGPPGAEPPRKRGAAVPVLAGLTALFLIVAGVFVGLYVDKTNKLSAEQRTAASQKKTIDENTSEIDKLQRDLRAKTDQLTETEQRLRGSQSSADNFKQERDTIGKCLTLLLEASEAAERGDRATYNAKAAELREPCDKTEQILGI